MYTVCYVGRLTDLLNYAYLFGGTVYVDTKRTCANRTLSGQYVIRTCHRISSKRKTTAGVD